MRKRMKKAIVSCILTLAMVISLLPASTEQAYAVEPPISVGIGTGSIKYIYANGNKIILEAGETSNETKIYIDTNGNGEIDDGAQYIDLNGDSYFGTGVNALSGSAISGFDLSKVNIYGGKESGSLDIGTKITMLGGNVKEIFGGGRSSDATNPANITGNTSIDVKGGTVGKIYGGGNGSFSTIYGNTNITLTGGVITTVNGGGDYGSVCRVGDPLVGGTANIKVASGATITTIYGGGSSNDNSNAVDRTNIIVDGGTVNNIYSGSNYGKVVTSTNITINGGTINGTIYGGGRFGEVGSSAAPAECNITINGGAFQGSSQFIYGGGYWAKVYGNTNIVFNTGYSAETLTVCGGGYGAISSDMGYIADIIGDTSILVNGGAISTIYGGGSNYSAVSGASITVNGGNVTNLYLGGKSSNCSAGSASASVSGGAITNISKGSVSGSAQLTYTGGTISGTVDTALLIPIKLTGVTANGASGTTTTTQLTLTFDKDPGTLITDNITVTGATKGTLSGTGTTRTLDISNVPYNDYEVTVTVALPVYAVTHESNTVKVFKYVPTIGNVIIAPTEVNDSDRASAGITVGNLSVNGTPTEGITYELDGDLDNNSLFQIVGDKLQIKSGTTLDNIYYNIWVKAWEEDKPENTRSEGLRFPANIIGYARPTVTSITRQNPTVASTSGSSITYRVTFSESVSGVDISDFTLTRTGLAGASIASVSIVSGSAIDVTVNTGTGDGTLRLDLNTSDTGITDLMGDAIAGGYTAGETYTVDHTAPMVMSIPRKTPSDQYTNANSITFTVNFSENVKGVDASDFQLVTTGAATGSIASVSNSTGNAIDVTVNTGAGTGTIRIDFIASGTGITDMAGNTIQGGFSGGASYTVDKTAPTVISIRRNNPSNQNTNVDTVLFTVTFNDYVNGVDVGDFTLTTTEGNATGYIYAAQSSGTTVNVRVSGITGQGTLRLDLKSSGTGIKDIVGNDIQGGFSSGEVYTVDRTAPTVTSITRRNPVAATTSGSGVTYRVTFSESVSGVGADDFVMNTVGTTVATIESVSATSGSVIEVTVSTGTGDGTLRLDLKASGTGIIDDAGNAIEGGYTEGDTYTIDHTAPEVASIARLTPSAERTNAASVTYRVTFSEDVSGVDTTDFELDMTGDATGSITSVSSSSGRAIDVKVSTGSGNGILRLNLRDSGSGIKDIAGNAIAEGFVAGEAYTVDKAAPRVSAIARKTPSTPITNAGSVIYQVVFSENVKGVDIGDFTLTTIEGDATGSIASVSSSSGSAIDVTVDSVAGYGMFKLVLKNLSTGITDDAGNAIDGGYTLGEVYSVDRTAPTVTSITRKDPLAASTSGSSVTYRVIFSESVSGLDASDFTLTKTGLADASIASVSIVSGSAIDVIVNTDEGDGTLRLDMNASDTGITDLIGNAITGGFTGGQTYTIDRSAPTLTAGAVARTSDTSATVKFTSNEAGKYYYIVVASGAAQPSIDTTGAGTSCSAAENTITLLTLSAGTKDIYIVVKDAVDNVSVNTFKISIPAYVAPPSDGGGSGGNGGNSGGSNDGGAADSSKKDSNKAVEIRVNDIVLNAGIKVDTKVEGKLVTTVSLDQKMIDEKITAEGKNAVITIPIDNTAADALVAELNGQMVKNMEQKAAVIEVKTDSATYILPALQIDIENISGQLGRNLELSDIKVKVEIAKTSAETNAMVERVANNDRFTVIAAPVDFSVRCTYGDETVDVSRFNNYVVRTVAIPEGIDTTKITTGVVVAANGNVRHVPTKIEVIGGKYFAKINSLTNSTYAVVWNPITYKDVKKNSTGKAINDLGSRMVISGAKNGLFRPEHDITRAEFVAMLVTSLGLEPGTEDTLYKDVKLKDWYSKYIEAANEYGIISGSAKAKFRPKDKITTEEAMTMLNNAMKLTELKVKFKKGEAKKLLAGLAKAEEAQVWSDNSMAVCIKAGIVTVKNNQKISPKDKLTRAEAAVMIRKLLVKSNLI